MSTILPIDLIKNYPDFPEKGINFKDLTPNYQILNLSLI